jgi:hypothetical protein
LINWLYLGLRVIRLYIFVRTDYFFLFRGRGHVFIGFSIGVDRREQSFCILIQTVGFNKFLKIV